MTTSVLALYLSISLYIYLYLHLVAALNRLEKRLKIHCFFSYTMKLDASESSSTIDYTFNVQTPNG